MNYPVMELTCVRRLSTKDGKLRLYWRTGLQVPITQKGTSYVVGGVDSIKDTHRVMMRLAPALATFGEFLQSEPMIEGAIASIFIVPDEIVHGDALARIVQALKDDYRIKYPTQH